MNFIIQGVIGLFGWLGMKTIGIAKSAAQFFILVGINSSVVAAFAAYIAAIIYSISWLYEQINKLLAFLDTHSGDDILSRGFTYMKSLGIWDGAVDAFSTISIGLSGLFVIFLSKFILKGLLHLRMTVLSFIIALKS